MIVDLGGTDLPNVDRDGDRLRGDTAKDAARYRAVVKIATMRHLYILRTDETVVSGVEREPTRASKDLDPRMGRALALHEAAHISGREASEAAHGDSDMGEILTYAATEVESLRRRRIDRSGAGLIGHLTCETIH